MIFKKIIDYCKTYNLSISSFEKLCDIGNGTISAWKDNKSKPSLKTLEKISKITNLPITYFLEEED